MTERGRRRLTRDATSLAIGPSSLVWDGTTLTIRIEERTAPYPSRISGTVRLKPAALSHRLFDLDAAGAHRWRPVAPCSTVEVALDSPALHWTGPAYADMNTGDAPLETAFRQWNWSRAATPTGTTILYDVDRRDGTTLALALAFDPAGGMTIVGSPPLATLPKTLWRVARTTRADTGRPASVGETLEDAPFYARSILASHLHGAPVTAIHESLSLDRFRSPIVQAMLPFRMPRRA